ncbi:glycosyltransferase [Capnocytophaga sp. oral taxon 878]|uniref:glycosyltransferase n=1 Tax=Capnocytophaga sp. oral taxon 878 TaxID=1316596 RepID=UPI000D03E238|nr:glycosyltransferase [Capnocytophaga sp. oral taxon 878]AVM51345.1 lipopolysaccharide biosynthesis protein [Capnocytophaga sp. oral taxon 878]
MRVIKQNKLWFYLYNYALIALGKRGGYEREIERLKAKISAGELEELQKRVDYYCKLRAEKLVTGNTRVGDLKTPKSPKTYYFETYEYARFWNPEQAIDFVFGDVIHVPETPSVVKSRPISDDNENSVLLKLDKPRHFIRIEGDKPFDQKKDMMIGRGAIYQDHRFDFYNKHFGNPLCNLGSVDKNGLSKPEWLTEKTSMKEHLDYKFILSLQGNDVASNLKWVMSSNSVAVMPKPTIETWFMEGTLKGGVHYIEIAADYSDLEEQLRYYIARPKECMEILENAHRYVAQFWKEEAEELCNLLVLEKYFSLTK